MIQININNQLLKFSALYENACSVWAWYYYYQMPITYTVQDDHRLCWMLFLVLPSVLTAGPHPSLLYVSCTQYNTATNCDNLLQYWIPLTMLAPSHLKCMTKFYWKLNNAWYSSWITMEYRLTYVTQVHTAKWPFKVSLESSGSEHKTKEYFKRRKPHTAVL